MTFEDFMRHAADAAYLGDESGLAAYARKVFAERDAARAEVDRLRADVYSCGSTSAQRRASVCNAARAACSAVEAACAAGGSSDGR